MTTPDPRIETVISLIAQSPEGVGVSDLEPKFTPPVPRRTLQLWLADLVAQKRLKARGAGRATRYVAPKLAPVPGAATVANSGQTAAPTNPIPATIQPAYDPVRAPAAASTKPSLPLQMPGPWAAAPASAPITQPSVPRPTQPAIPRAQAVAVPVETAAPEPTDSAPAEAYDPRFARVFRSVLPQVVRTCGSRDSAESDLILEGVRLFHDDSITIRTMAAQGVAILDALTEDGAVAWGVTSHAYQVWRKYWR